MEDVFKFYRVNEDIKGLIYKQIHKGNQDKVNEVINDIIGFNTDYIRKWRNTNQLYLLINKHFVIRQIPNKYNNHKFKRNQEIKKICGDYWNGIYILSFLDNRDIPYMIRKSKIYLESFNLEVLQNYIEKNIMYSLLIGKVYKKKYNDDDAHINIDNDILKYDGTRTNNYQYKQNNYIEDINDVNKTKNYINLLFNSNVINNDFISYRLRYNNNDLKNLSSVKDTFKKKILEIHLLECDFNTRTDFYRREPLNEIVDLKYKYKYTLQDLMYDNKQKAWKRLTKKQLINRLLSF